MSDAKNEDKTVGEKLDEKIDQVQTKAGEVKEAAKGATATGMEKVKDAADAVQEKVKDK